MTKSGLVSLIQAFFILGGSLVSESATLLVAINSLKKGAAKADMSFWEYGNAYCYVDNAAKVI